MPQFKFTDIFRATNKKREDAAGLNDDAQTTKVSAPDKPKEDKKPEMTQADFSYGPEGMQRKKKQAPPASMKP